MIIGIPTEIFPGERRVALVPAAVPTLVKAGCEVVVETGAGSGVGYADTAYTEKGARVASARAEVFKASDVVVQVLCHGANDRNGRDDLRPAAKEQVQSLGGRFVELPLEAADSQDARGYARAQDETFYRRQRELLARVVAESDVVITAALVPGKDAPVLITADMVTAMAPGSVIVDLAAERGGNCQLTRPNETVVEHGVTVIGSFNLAGTAPYHASQMYSKNVTNFVLHLLREGRLGTPELNLEDEITRETLVTRGGEVVNPRVREILAAAIAAGDAAASDRGRP